MDDLNKKVNPDETPKDEKIKLTDDDAEKAAGGLGPASLRVEPEQVR